MKIMSLISCVLFAAVATAAQDFKLLKHNEFKKLTKEQQIEYVKELSKRMGSAKKNKNPDRSSSNTQPSIYQIVLSEILPTAYAEDEDDNGQALQRQYEKASKATPIDAEKRDALLRQKAQIEYNKQKYEELLERTQKLQKTISITAADIQETQNKIKELEKRNRSLNANEHLSALKLVNTNKEVSANSDKIEVLNERLSTLTEKDKKIKAEVSAMSKELSERGINASLATSEAQEIQKKLDDMNAQLERRDVALRKQAELSNKISDNEEKIAELKRKIEDQQNKNDRLQAEIDKSDDPETKTELGKALLLGSSSIQANLDKIKELTKDVQVKTGEKDQEVRKTTPRAKEIAVANAGGKNKLYASGDARAVIEDTPAKTTPSKAPEMTDKQLAAANKNCAKITEENAAMCAHLKDSNMKPTSNPANPAPTPTPSAKPASTKPSDKPENAKADDKKKDDKKETAESFEEYCPNAGFVVGLKDPAKTKGCPGVQSIKEGEYVGKITKGIAADAKCPNKSYGPEQTLVCMPFAFGLTKDNEAICVAPKNNASALCKNEAKAKSSYGKAVQVINENPGPYNEWVNAFNDMCDAKAKKDSPRWPDTSDTCDVLIDQHETVQTYSEKNAPKPKEGSATK